MNFTIYTEGVTVMRTAHEAARFFKEKDQNRPGMCLYETQAAFNAPHMYPNAITQWHAAKDKHPNDRTPKYGAPVYFAGGQHGHVAMYVGNGKVRSTDAGGRGKMATVSIDWFRQHWGYSYLGWTGDIGGQKITFDDKIHVYLKKLKPGVDNSNSVRMLRLALIRRGFLKVSKPLSVKRPGNRYTKAVSRAVCLYQRKHGYKETGVLTKQQAKRFFAVNSKVVLHT